MGDNKFLVIQRPEDAVYNRPDKCFGSLKHISFSLLVDDGYYILLNNGNTFWEFFVIFFSLCEQHRVYLYECGWSMTITWCDSLSNQEMRLMWGNEAVAM